MIVFHTQMATLREQLGVLEDTLQKSKNRCRTVLDQNGFDEEFVVGMINKAESHEPKNPHLHRVYRSYQKVKDKRKEIRAVEQRLEDLESERKQSE